jgi:hypothetical protein
MAVKVNLTVNDNGFKAKMQQAIGAFKSMTTAITGAKNAQQALNNLIKANPMGLITTVGAAACETIYKYVAGVYDAEKAQAAWAREIENTSQQLQQMKDDADFDIAIAKAAGKSSMELANLRVEAAKARVAVADLNFDRVFGAYLNDEATKEQVDEMRNMQKAAEDALNSANRARTVLDIQKINGTGNTNRKGGGGGANKEITWAADSIKAQEVLVSDLRTKWYEAGAGVRDEYLAQLIEAEKKLKEMNDAEGMKRERMQGRLLLKPEDIIMPDTSNLNLALNDTLDKIRDYMKDHPVIVPVETVKNDIDGIVKSARMTADVVGSIGDAFNAIEDPAAKVAGTVAQAIATVAAGYAQATLAAAQTGNPWVWVAFAASGLAQMLTMISTIHSATGYAEGGIVRGNTYSNDQIFAGLNAGEVVLNRAQSGVLASQLEGNNGGFADGQIVGVLQGEHIALVAKRWGKRTGRGENLSFKIS